MKALTIEEIHTYYGRSHVLSGVSLEVQEREIVCLLGRNGAGKTTTIRSVMGLTPPSEGKILVYDEMVQGMKPYDMYKLGVRWIPQGRRIFPMLTVEENLKLALVASGVQNGAKEIDKVFALFPVLQEKRLQRGRTLSGGQLQMLAIARALIGSCRLILMDEPSEGLAPLLIQQVCQVILSIRAQGTTVLLAEQHFPMALTLADRHYIIDNGKIRFEGSSSELQGNEEVKSNYLGVTKRQNPN